MRRLKRLGFKTGGEEALGWVSGPAAMFCLYWCAKGFMYSQQLRIASKDNLGKAMLIGLPCGLIGIFSIMWILGWAATAIQELWQEIKPK